MPPQAFNLENTHDDPENFCRDRSFPSLTGACSDSGVEVDPTYGNKDRDNLYKNGSLVSDEGGSNLMGGPDKPQAQEGSGIGVNGFLWRATLDTISFMPITIAYPFGGVIIYRLVFAARYAQRTYPVEHIHPRP